ncbi:GNAT family N-acetyltransferase [Arsenicicoccus sp. oral taxon 190]|uniref:GNAT family N-acetyltransferase n=1 Tax=Arsenicicoccus sp. oral taxon 190 TaxID=1658671 RepID=UPI00067B598E|nr:GNAT family N-acetyltransferase [Arsenicicoccus sp. oral taxon 190]
MSTPDGRTGLADVALCAQGEAAMQRVLHVGLGSRWRADDEIAWSLDPAPHRYLLGAVTLRPDVPAARLVGLPGTVCDSFGSLSQADLPGRAPEPENVWMVRHPAPLPPSPSLPGLDVRPVVTDDEVQLWERITFEANGAPPDRPGELHPRGSQRQAGLTLWLAVRGGRPVGTSLGIVASGCVTVSAVAVLPEARGRGIGSALTRSVIASAPTLPATLSASEDALGVYERLGFVALARSVHWS